MNLKHLGGLASVVQDILKKYLGGLPDVVQYIVVIAMVLVILYLCLIVTRALGRGKGEFVHYDDNEENDKNVPDLFASTKFRRKEKRTEYRNEK